MYLRLNGGGSLPKSSRHCCFRSEVGVVFSAVSRPSTLSLPKLTAPASDSTLIAPSLLFLRGLEHRSGGRHSPANFLRCREILALTVASGAEPAPPPRARRPRRGARRAKGNRA